MNKIKQWEKINSHWLRFQCIGPDIYFSHKFRLTFAIIFVMIWNLTFTYPLLRLLETSFSSETEAFANIHIKEHI